MRALVFGLIVLLFILVSHDALTRGARPPAKTAAGHVAVSPQMPAGAQGQSAGFDLKGYYAQHRHEAADVFIRRFPYGQYLQSVQFTDFATLQEHRYFLYRAKGIGDAFLYYLADHFVKLYPPRQAHLQEFIAIGEAYLASGNERFHTNVHVNRRIAEIYQTIGYFLLGRTAAFLQQEIEAGRWNPETPSHEAVFDRLAKSRVYVSYEKSTWQKLRHHAGQGNWDYIAKRGWNKVSKYASGLAPNRLRKWVGNTPATGPAPAQTLTLVGLRGYAQVSGSGNHGVHLFRVKRGGQAVGYAVWMRRPIVKSSYLARRRDGRSVAQRFQQRQRRHRTVLAMTGGFTNSAGQPEGLTIEDGETVNAVIMPDRDGLVFFGRDGGVRVADLRRRAFTLPLSRQRTTRPLRPTERMADYATLINWCRQQDATVFQTQLLAYADSMRIDPAKAPGELRERRLLALARAPDGTLSHIVFDLTAQTALADAAQQVFGTLRARNLKVEALLNLDVGSHNILRVYGPNGKRWPTPAGPVALQAATNLIVYAR